MSKWYGNIMNRLEEDRMFVPVIEVGTGMTEYSWSDRHAYEVVSVRDQKHVSVRELGHRHTGEPFTNEWELFPVEDNPIRDMVKRGKYWYWTETVTADQLSDDPAMLVRMSIAGFDTAVIRAKGKQTKLKRARVSFGKADYYYDYSF